MSTAAEHELRALAQRATGLRVLGSSVEDVLVRLADALADGESPATLLAAVSEARYWLAQADDALYKTRARG